MRWCEVDLRRTSASELACDAGTFGTLSAGGLSRFDALEHLPCSMVIGHVAASATESHCFTQLSLGHVRLSGSEVDGWMTLDKRHPTMWLRHAADGRPCPELGKTSDLRLSVWNSQILLT